MKIALGMRDFFPRKGGAERSVAELMYFLSGEGHEVHIFTHRSGKVKDELFLHRVPAIPFPKSLKVLSFAWLCSRRMRGQDFDVTIGVGNTLKADLLWSRGGVQWYWFWRSLKVYNNPFVWGINLLAKIISPKQWAEALVQGAPYKKAKKIVAISGMVKRDIIERFGIPEERIVVICTGVDIQRFSPENRRFREDVRGYHGISSGEKVCLFSSHNFTSRSRSNARRSGNFLPSARAHSIAIILRERAQIEALFKYRFGVSFGRLLSFQSAIFC